MTSKLTREELLNIIETDHVQCGEAAYLARIALAAIDSEPVAYTDERNLGYIDRGRETAYLWGKQNSEAGDVPLYRHAQQPVVPDGYVMVPKEMTDEIGEAIAMQANCCGGIALDIYDAMLAAAPHDTPTLNSLQSVDSVADTWIPVSERMPEGSEEVLCAKEFDGPGDWRKKVGYLLAGKWTVYGASWAPTHWMPLPNSPQEAK